MNSPKVVTLPALILAAILVSPSAVAQTVMSPLQPPKVVTAIAGAAAADAANRSIHCAVKAAAAEGRLDPFQSEFNNQVVRDETSDDDALRGLALDK